MAKRRSDALVSAARAGDQAAWRSLYGLHHRRLTVWLRSLPPGDALDSPEDLAADAWLLAAVEAGRVQRQRRRLRRLAVHPRAQPRRQQPPQGRTPAYGPHRGRAVRGRGLGRRSRRPRPRRRAGRHPRAALPPQPREAEVVACIDVVGLDVASTARALGMKPHRRPGRPPPRARPAPEDRSTSPTCNESGRPRHVSEEAAARSPARRRRASRGHRTGLSGC